MSQSSSATAVQAKRPAKAKLAVPKPGLTKPVTFVAFMKQVSPIPNALRPFVMRRLRNSWVESVNGSRGIPVPSQNEVSRELALAWWRKHGCVILGNDIKRLQTKIEILQLKKEHLMCYIDMKDVDDDAAIAEAHAIVERDRKNRELRNRALDTKKRILQAYTSMKTGGEKANHVGSDDESTDTSESDASSSDSE